jgi:flagellar hook-associated protein 1
MAGLLDSLSAASASLNAQSQAIAVVSNNIANVNNPDYSEETPTFNDLGMVQTAEGPESLGLTVSVSQQRSAVLDTMVQQEASLTAGFTAQQNVLQQAQAALGENITSSSSSSTASTTTESGLSASIDAFFNAFENLAANPTDEGAQETVVEQAGVLTDRFQEVDQNLAQVQSDAQAQTTSSVTTANTLLQDVATLNSQIASFESNDPGSAVDLRDQREGDLEQLAALMPVTVTENSQGEDTITAASAGGPVTLVSDGTVSNPLSYSASTGVISAGTTALTLASGSLAGTLSASTGAVQTLRTSLDALANQIVTSVNSAYNPSATTGDDFFDPSGTTAGTIAVASGISSSTLVAGDGSPGDNSIATAVANVANQQFSTTGGDDIDGTIDEFYGDTASNIGQAVDTANTQVTDQTNVQTIVTNQRNSVSGVSLDQEMSNLMTYQTAYQASSELFSTINTMLGDLITDLTGSS